MQKKKGFSFYARLSPLHNKRKKMYLLMKIIMHEKMNFFFMLDYLPFIIEINVPINENVHARKNYFLFYARLSPLHNRNKWKNVPINENYHARKNVFFFMLDYLPFIIEINEKNVRINENYHARKKDFLFI